MSGLGTLSYGLAALGYLVLAIMLVVAWEGRGQGPRLIMATFATALWAAALALFAAEDAAPPVLAFLAETVRHAAWLVVLTGLVATAGFPRLLARSSYLLWLVVLASGLTAMVIRPALFSSISMAAGVLLPLVGLVLLEQVYRNANTSGRWAFRHLYLGLGGMFVYDIFLYSQALLLGGISLDVWYARGLVFVMSLPFIALAARRNPDWSIKLFVSRDVAFYTTSFVAVGGYLLLMAAGGYLVRLLGGSWGYFAEIVFFAGSLVLLAALIGSAVLRRRLKVFLVKNFYKHKYEYREEWLRFIATLSDASTAEDPRTTSLRAIAQIIGSPGAVLLLDAEGRRQFTVAGGWPSEQLVGASREILDVDPQLLDFLQGREWVIDLAEYRRDREIYEQLTLPAWLTGNAQWRLIVPVLLGDTLRGLVLLANPPHAFTLTFEDRDLLKTVARHVATHLAQHEAEQRLADARQFEAYSRLTAFLMHDLKNVVAQLQLIVSNADRHKRNPEFVDDAIATVDNTARRITRLIEQLGRADAPQAQEPTALDELVAAAVQHSLGREPAPTVTIEATGLKVTANRERLLSIIEHVIRNAQEATPANGQVQVRVSPRNAAAVIAVSDTGEGMSAEFIRERLFRPFDSTKGSKGMGIGAYQARDYTRSLGGDVEVESTPGKGTHFRIILPLIDAST
jgi:putative PEP-CTERM system histidine kinase